jgi:CRISPR-associated endonuclease/helicase Cas3
MTYRDFFQQATNGQSPYAYQSRIAGGPDADASGDFNESGPCQSQLISIPTGLGKTAAVTLAWLWNRVHKDSPAWPRRLVYCLPMRTLVEQTAEEARKWIRNTALPASSGPAEVHVLMGGEDADKWDIYPEKNAILIGTQDMLLSRALNRGYGMSRYRWPMHFGLLNNDCLWVMDETQLMGVSLETSAQLDGFRSTWPTVTKCPTWWMSATMDNARLATVDHLPPPDGWLCLGLSDIEKSCGRPHELYEAKKSIDCCEIQLSAASKAEYPRRLAAIIAQKHQPGTLTLVVINRVSRAQEVFSALTTRDKKTKESLYDPSRVALVHSRFRGKDRAAQEQLLFGEGDRIVIATQAVEAGVDVSARLLITELAPWPSLVQRMGRCNRRAESQDAEILWVDIQPKDAKDNICLPYEEADLTKARESLKVATDGSPRELSAIAMPEDPVVRPVIRRRDLLDLFDTTPDICGQDLDISRYIRDSEDNDVQFFWREVAGDVPSPDTPAPQRDELCRVAIGEAAKFLKKDKLRAWRWNALDELWEAVKNARPGGVYLIDSKSGGYSVSLGWTGESKDQPACHDPGTGESEAHDDEPLTFNHQWQSLHDHTSEVVAEMDCIASEMAAIIPFREALLTAARWHDAGKAHPVFQTMLRGNDEARANTLWAKSGKTNGQCSRRGYRHELASALAWLVSGPPDAHRRDLVGYLIAAHHGKVRLSIRSLPGENGDPDDNDRTFARGIWHGEQLPQIDLPGLIIPETKLDLSFMLMGAGPHGPSWLSRSLSLRDEFGPFKLAFLETLLRSADSRASARAQSKPENP